jgi:phage-related tail fiber protein
MTTLDIRGTVVGETAVAIKAPCLVATTGADITLAGVQAIDGVTVGNSSERVLVKDQTDLTQNGIYIAGAAAWVLAADWQGNTNVVCGTMVMVAGGAVNAGILFVQTCTDSPVVIGVSDIVFVNAARRRPRPRRRRSPSASASGPSLSPPTRTSRSANGC